MFVTDAQVHIWGANTPERPWPEEGVARAHRVPPLGVEELISEMDRAGVDRAVIVPPSFEGDRNDVALDAARRYPERLAVMGRVTLDEPGSADLAHWREQPGMLGVRLTFHTGESFERAEWFWPGAAAAQLPVMVFAPGRSEEIGRTAAANPGVRFVVDHCNVAVTAVASELPRIIETLLPLSAIENVAVKVSALPCASGDSYPFASLSPLVRRVVDAFGAQRCMWGSDISRLPCPYADWKNAMLKGMGVLTPEEVDWLMGRSLERWLGWPEPTTASS